MKNLSRERCAFQIAEQRAYYHILTKVASWAWVRERRSEDAYWTPVLNSSDDSAVMLDSVGVVVVEQPFSPTGACGKHPRSSS